MGTKGIERAGLWKGTVLSVLSIMLVENLPWGRDRWLSEQDEGKTVRRVG